MSPKFSMDDLPSLTFRFCVSLKRSSSSDYYHDYPISIARGEENLLLLFLSNYRWFDDIKVFLIFHSPIRILWKNVEKLKNP